MQLAGTPTDDEVDRFKADLAALVGEEERVGLAVSGGPDSLALLLLAQDAIPGRFAVATVDHRLRAESEAEAASVAQLCEGLSVPHEILEMDWEGEAPQKNVQARARKARYELLEKWAASEAIPAIATAHHADDQAETMLMRLTRGAGLSGLAATRKTRHLNESIRLVRPLLGWRKRELETIVHRAGLQAADDPSNRDPAHDRSRLRAALNDAGFEDSHAYAASASHLAEAEEALAWTALRLAEMRLRPEAQGFTLVRGTIPSEMLRRILLIALDRMGDKPPRGPDLARAIAALERGGQATLGNTLLRVEGESWVLEPAPPRKTM